MQFRFVPVPEGVGSDGQILVDPTPPLGIRSVVGALLSCGLSVAKAQGPETEARAQDPGTGYPEDRVERLPPDMGDRPAEEAQGREPLSSSSSSTTGSGDEDRSRRPVETASPGLSLLYETSAGSLAGVPPAAVGRGQGACTCQRWCRPPLRVTFAPFLSYLPVCGP